MNRLGWKSSLMSVALLLGACADDSGQPASSLRERSAALETCSAALCDDGNPCTKDYCSLTKGCLHRFANREQCTDGDACTFNDRCFYGACLPGTSVVCRDGSECTTDACLSGAGCVFTPVACDDGNPCSADSCDPALGCLSIAANGEPCDDGNPCTVGDFCAAKKCFGGTPDPCDDGDLCTIDSCDPGAGCGHVLAPDGTVCDDDESCTSSDVCTEGVCAGAIDPICPDPGDCCTAKAEPECSHAAIRDCVCAADELCCTTAWDQTCVDEVLSVCGLDCNACIPDCAGKPCGDDGCGGSCGVCLPGSYENPGLSCKDILAQLPGAETGPYYLDLDGPGGAEPLVFDCDMTTAGGGFTEITLAQAHTVLGGAMVATVAAAIARIDASHRPYTQDKSGNHSYTYTFQIPFGFKEFLLGGYTGRAYAASGNTTDIYPSSFKQSVWTKAYLEGGTGDLSFGSPNESGPVTSFGKVLTANFECQSCDLVWPHATQVYTLPAEATAFRIGWGEAGPQLEGWYPWWSGTIRVR